MLFILLHLFITTIYIIYYALLSQFTNFPITNYVTSVEVTEHKSIVHNLSPLYFLSTTLSYATLPPTHNQSHHPQPFHLPTTSLPSHNKSTFPQPILLSYNQSHPASLGPHLPPAIISVIIHPSPHILTLQNLYITFNYIFTPTIPDLKNNETCIIEKPV